MRMQTSGKERVRQAFAGRFRKALNELGYSENQQKKMEALFGVSGQAVRKWAEGTAMPTPSRMPEVAAVLGVRRAWLQDGEEPMRPHVGRVADGRGRSAKHPEALPISGEEIDLLRTYRKLTPEQQGAVRTIILLLSGAPKKRQG